MKFLRNINFWSSKNFWFWGTKCRAILKNRLWDTWEGAATLKVISFIYIFLNFNHIHMQVYIVKTSTQKLDVHENQVSQGYQKKVLILMYFNCVKSKYFKSLILHFHFFSKYLLLKSTEKSIGFLVAGCL